MSHTRLTIVCACALLLTTSFLAFGSNKEEKLEHNIDNTEISTEVVETIETSPEPEDSESEHDDTYTHEATNESNSEEKKENKKESTIIKETESIDENTESIKETIKQIETISVPETKPYITKYVPSNNSFKSYMGYKAITSKSSPQYKLQLQAYTGEYGIRMVNIDGENRYCIALGSFYTTKIGTKIDVVMANGNILKCILGDMKANIHTDAQNIRARDGSVVEFIIDSTSLHPMARRMGNVSYAAEKFSGEIKEIRVYQN